MSVTATLNVTFGVSETTTSNTAGSTTEAYTGSYTPSITSGTGAGQANVQWSESASLNGTSTLNLQSLTGATATKSFNNILGIYLQNLGTSGNITLGPAGTNPFAGPWTTTGPVVAPGGVYCVYDPAGWPVTSTTDSVTLTTSVAVPFALAIVGN